MDAEVRYNLFLALKESLNNLVKHSRAAEVWLRLTIAPEFFTLAVEDNGRGLAAENADAKNPSAERLASGSGLTNMEKRLEAVGGRCEISSTANGTRVALTVFVASPVVAIGRAGKSG